jgi:hypothetical protein
MATILHFLVTASTSFALLFLAIRWIRKGGLLAKITALFIFGATGSNVASTIFPGLGFAMIVGLAACVAIPLAVFVVLPIAGSMLAASANSLRRDAAAFERERVAFLNAER